MRVTLPIFIYAPDSLTNCDFPVLALKLKKMAGLRIPSLILLLSIAALPARADCPLPGTELLSDSQLTWMTKFNRSCKSEPIYERYLSDTVAGLNKMRGPNG